MKRLFLLLMVAMAAISANAQTTFNIRAGVGTTRGVDWCDSKNIYRPGGTTSWEDKIGYESEYDNEMTFAPVVAIEMNVPLGSKASKWVFSPSVMCALPISPVLDAKLTGLMHFGYKFSAGNSGIFMPKVGFMGGVETEHTISMYGPSCELAYETKHIVIAANAYYNIGKFVEREVNYYEDEFGNAYGYDEVIKKADGIGVYLTFGYKF